MKFHNGRRLVDGPEPEKVFQSLSGFPSILHNGRRLLEGSAPVMKYAGDLLGVPHPASYMT